MSLHAGSSNAHAKWSHGPKELTSSRSKNLCTEARISWKLTSVNPSVLVKVRSDNTLSSLSESWADGSHARQPPVHWP